MLTYRDIAFLVSTLSTLFIFELEGQTCCTAGAPLSNSLSIASQNEMAAIINLEYEYKGINLLIDNNEVLENDDRRRFGQNILLRPDLILNEKWSFSVVIPFVHQSRETFSISETSFGLGDILLLSQYTSRLNSVNQFSFSLGLKLPTAKVNHRSASNILLSPDMQSGSGSYDQLLRFSYSRSDFLMPFLGIHSAIIFRKNGQNNEFGKTETFDGRRFAFGNEIIINVGFDYLSTYKIGFLKPDANFKLRFSEANEEQDLEAPNSGGYWTSIDLGLTYIPTEKSTVRIYGEIPLAQFLNGLQISTNITWGLQYSYLFSLEKNKHEI